MKRLLFALALLCASSCRTADLTQLMVSVDTDLNVPAELDGLTIDITGPQGELRRAMGSLDGEMALPATLGVVWRGGALTPIDITVTGSLDGTDVIQYRARAAFAEDQVRLLRIVLGRDCVGVGCDLGETCDPRRAQEDMCRSALVEESEYEEWTGRPDRIDGGGGGPDGGTDGGTDGCVPKGEICNGMDDDCDDAVDEPFDLNTDPNNCGSCGTVCDTNPPHGSGVCSVGSCTLVCDSGWADCNSDVSDGCETSLSAPASCGACGTTCTAPDSFCANPDGSGFACTATCDAPATDCTQSCVDLATSPVHCGRCDNGCSAPPRARAICTGGSCGFACDSGFRNCDGLDDNGCESALEEIGNCGACGVSCAPTDAVASCAAGTCEIVGCVGSSADCNATVVDGCEVDLADDVDNCGSCGNACPSDPRSAAAACVDGRCVLRCDSGFANCNGDIEDGCEVSLAEAETCGSCGIRCDDPTPLCSPHAEGGFECASTCGAGTTCGSSCTDTTSDPLHCGGCATTCPEPPGASRTCAAGACGFTCDPGRRDCNDNPADGCEASINSLEHCGDCNQVCNPSDAEGFCSSGVCVIAVCDPGFANCDGSASNGCEVDVTGDAANCGDCGTDCTALSGVTTVGCTRGDCRIDACEPGRADCDSNPSTGCEANTESDPLNCGGCGIDCGAGTCNAGACE